MMDFIHSEELGDALIARIADNLDDTLKVLAFGDFREYAVRGDSILDDLPAVFVVPTGISPYYAAGGIGNVAGTAETFRVTMARKYSAVTVARDKAQRMKALCAALFVQPRFDITDAEVVRVDFSAAQYDDAIIDALLQPVWAISVDVTIICRTGP